MSSAIDLPCLVEGCKRRVPINLQTHYELSGGYVTKRKGGGPNQITAPVYTGRVICGIHFGRLRETGHAEQGQLLV